MAYHMEILQKLFSLLSKAVSIVLLIVLFLVLQYLFDMDYICSCSPGLNIIEVFFILAPPFILNSIVIAIQAFYQKGIYKMHRFCSFHLSNGLSCIGYCLVKYIFLCGVWASAVLLDGEWYFCIMTNEITNQTGMPCKDDLTYEEKLIKNNYKNTSKDIGFIVLCVIFFIWNIVECCKPHFLRKKVVKNPATQCDLFFPAYYRWFYENLLSEEVNSHLKEELKNIAGEKAKKLCEKYIMDIRHYELQAQSGDHNPSDNSHSSNSDDDIRTDNDTAPLARNTQSDISITWQTISLPYFYLKNECEESWIP